MSALIPGITGGIYREKISTMVCRNFSILRHTYLFWDFKYVVQNVQTCSIGLLEIKTILPDGESLKIVKTRVERL